MGGHILTGICVASGDAVGRSMDPRGPIRRPPRAALWLLSLLLVLALSLPAESQVRFAAVIQTLSGRVEVFRGGRRIDVTRSGFGLQIGDRVRTGPNSTASVVTAQGVRQRLGPNGEIEVRARGPQINAGKASFWITGRGRTEIATPAAIAAAEGTGFLIEVEPDGLTTVTVAEGAVLFYNEQGQVRVGENQSSTARPGQAPTRPVAADASGVLLFEATVESLPLPVGIPLLGLPEARLRGELAARRDAAAGSPADPDVHLALGDVLYDLGEIEEAGRVYETALRLRPGDSRAAGRLVRVHIAAGRPDLAEAALRRLGAMPGAEASSALGEGMLTLARGRAREALPFLTRATALDTSSVEAAVLLGRAQFRAGELPSARETLTSAVARSPESHAAHAYLSSVRLAEGDTRAAEQDARRAVELAPGSALAHEAFGAVLLFSGRSGDAIRELRRALELRPDSPSARIQLARALAASGELHAALDEAVQSVSEDPGDAPARVTLGVLFLAADDPDRAEREFRHALALAPALASARTGLASAALDRGAFARALREQQAGLALDAGSAQAHNNLGAVQLARGRFRQAEESFQAALRLQPGFALARANLAIVYLEQNKYAEALREAQEAVRLGERSARVRTTLARIYLRQNRPERALVELRVAETLDPFYPLARFYLSQVYRIQGRDRDAHRALFRGVLLDPSAMVEQRLYSRNEATLYGGENDTAGVTLKSDGLGIGSGLSHYLTAQQFGQDLRPRGGELNRAFAEAILGLEAAPGLDLILYGSYLKEKQDRPGRDLPGGGVEDPNFRSRFDGSDLQLMGRFGVGPRDWLNLKTGFRRGYFEAHNPDNPGGIPDRVPLRLFSGQDRQFFAEALWEAMRGSRDRDHLQLGLSYQDRDRSFFGRAPSVPGPGDVAILNREGASFFTTWAEWGRQFTPRLRISAGPYAGVRSRGETIVRPKAVVQYDAGGGNRLALLSYPTFYSQTADLLPVESWAQPGELDRVIQADNSVVSSYELAWERTTPGGSLLSLSAFYRRGRNLLVPIVDLVTAPIGIRLPYSRGEVVGGQIGLERPIGRSLTGRVFGKFQETNSLDAPGHLPYFPRWQTEARIDYLGRNGIRSFLAARYTGSRVHRDAFSGPERNLGGYVTADFRLTWQETLRRAWFVQVTDLFDRSADFYRGYHTAGRTLFGGVELRF